MKCPKCGYLGFEAVDRCRNCGYEFSLAPASATAELPIRQPGDSVEPVDDLALGSAAPSAASPLAAFLQEEGIRAAPRHRATPFELPLFGQAAPDDAPLITRPSPPRSPLSVRRATPEAPKLRSSQPRAPMLDLSPPLAAGVTAPVAGQRSELASLGARLTAVLLDLAILAAIDAVVIYFTLQICGLTIRELSVVIKGPLVAFLLFQNAGYLVAFTLGGQTLGKMAAGIKVVPEDQDSPLGLGPSIVRTLVWALLAAPAGLGFATALFSDDRRGLHDRCAGTRVIRATA